MPHILHGDGQGTRVLAASTSASARPRAPARPDAAHRPRPSDPHHQGPMVVLSIAVTVVRWRARVGLVGTLLGTVRRWGVRKGSAPRTVWRAQVRPVPQRPNGSKCHDPPAPARQSRAALVVLALASLALAVAYFTRTANALPSYLPGHQAGVLRHHTKHGDRSRRPSLWSWTCWPTSAWARRTPRTGPPDPGRRRFQPGSAPAPGAPRRAGRATPAR